MFIGFRGHLIATFATVVVGSNLHQVQNVNYIGYFTSHIVQWWQRKVQKSMLHVQSCWFALFKLLLFRRSLCRFRNDTINSLFSSTKAALLTGLVGIDYIYSLLKRKGLCFFSSYRSPPFLFPSLLFWFLSFSSRWPTFVINIIIIVIIISSSCCSSSSTINIVLSLNITWACNYVSGM